MSEATERARDPESTQLPERLVLYDGVCGLCNKSVRRLVRIDKDRKLRYAPLQGETATRLREQHSEIPIELDSFVYIEEGRVSLRSRAFVRMAKQFRYPWKALSWLWIIPWPLVDLGYRFIAKIRYRVWGKSDKCEIPTPTQRELFLD